MLKFISLAIPSIKTDGNTIARIIFCCWMLSSLILSNCYSSSFYSLLTLPEYSDTIDSLADLEEAAVHDTHNIVTWKDSSYLSEFMYATNSNRLNYAIGQHINR